MEERKGGKGFSRSKLDDVRSALKEMAPRETVSARAAVDELRDEIVAAQAKGRTLAEIRETMSELGLDVSLSTLRGYVRERSAKAEQGATAGAGEGRRRRGKKKQRGRVDSA